MFYWDASGIRHDEGRYREDPANPLASVVVSACALSIRLSRATAVVIYGEAVVTAVEEAGTDRGKASALKGSRAQRGGPDSAGA